MDVDDHPKTYRFRCTVRDPDDKKRIDHDFVEVSIKGGMTCL